MKKILLMLSIAILALTNTQAEESNVEVCKTYINEAKSFQETMDTNKVSESTLAFYKDQVVSNCGNIASKMSYEKNFFAQALIKKENATASNCKLAINMAKSYDNNGNNSPFIANAHKINVVDNCGTLMAKKSSAFCLFSKVDNTKENLKDKCVASIDKAHATMGTSSDFKNKGEVLRNCGRLYATI